MGEDDAKYSALELIRYYASCDGWTAGTWGADVKVPIYQGIGSSV